MEGMTGKSGNIHRIGPAGVPQQGAKWKVPESVTVKVFFYVLFA